MEEIKNDTIKNDAPSPIELPNNELVGFTQLRSDIRFLISQSSAPTYIPRTPLEHFFLYNNGGTRRLYVYDRTSGTWHYSSLT